jgi:hypothetical protein
VRENNVGFHVKREIASRVKRGPTPKEVEGLKQNPRLCQLLGMEHLLSEKEKRELRPQVERSDVA